MFEGTFYRGHLTSQELHKIVVGLQKKERETGFILHIIHIAGTRMKESGIDSLSRGDFLEGMMKGEDPLQYVPLDKGANTRSQGWVKQWIDSCWKNREGSLWRGRCLELLEPQDWFLLHECEELHLWVQKLQALPSPRTDFSILPPAVDSLLHPTL